MVGFGKTGKLIGSKRKVGSHRTKRQSTKTTDAAITKPAIRRLARRGGVKRISSFIYNDVR